jgi:hypothetical protein
MALDKSPDIHQINTHLLVHDLVGFTPRIVHNQLISVSGFRQR